MDKLRPHQQRLLEENPSYALLVHEMRTGKSLIGKNWSEHPVRNAVAVIVCIKSNKNEWVELCPNALVLTKEEFKRDWKSIEGATCIMVDEAHNFAAPLHIAKKRSALAEALYNFMRKHEGVHVLLLTATPLSNDPASLHTLLTYIGLNCDWKNYQSRFYNLEYKPFLPRPAWFAKANWREEANKILDKHADIVSFAECVGSVPPVTHEVIVVKTGKRPYEEDEEYHWTKDHLHEQSKKLPEIRRIGNGFRKVILVCHYTAQIDALEKQLKKDRPVFILDGRTKDAAKVKREAQEAPDCYLIVQAKMGMGWDGYMFSCMIFVSSAHRQIDYTQMLGRLTSVDHGKPMLYFHIHGGQWDKLIHATLVAGEDFNPHRHDTTRTAT